MSNIKGLRLDAAIRGDLDRELKRQAKVAEQAVTSGTRSGVYRTRRDMQRQIDRGKFRRGKSGAGLRDTLKVRSNPKRGTSLEPELRLFSVATYKATRGRRRQAIDLITIFSEGATINAARGKFLAIPTEYAPVADGRGFAKAGPEESGLPLRFIPAGSGGILVDARDTSPRPQVLWVLVKQVRISKRIDQERAIAKGIDKIPELIGKAWDKRAAKRGLI